MNTNSVLRDLLHQQPFRPIRIELATREVLRVPHPDYLSVPPSSSDRYSPLFVVYDARGNPRHVNPPLVASISEDTSSRSGRPPRRSSKS